ncbi:hypothetical protein [Streptomyces sp. NRRL S-241]|uniref:hypothetical protein n=1 Tax=Streptomyces sp. NRRL S-241 TaxID=1463896 RepID=UPI0004C1A7F2|nr:hypothetical protein [Streptomyces sp. NRRL S-241]
MGLPDNYELLALDEAGFTHEQIAAQYKVTRQAVTWRFDHHLKIKKRAHFQEVTSLMPWDVAAHPAKARLKQQAAFLGLRAYLRSRLDMEVSPRSAQAMKAFLNRVANGEVLAVGPMGAHYVPREPADGNLVVRWPADAPRHEERLELFELQVSEQND